MQWRGVCGIHKDVLTYVHTAEPPSQAMKISSNDQDHSVPPRVTRVEWDGMMVISVRESSVRVKNTSASSLAQ